MNIELHRDTTTENGDSMKYPTLKDLIVKDNKIFVRANNGHLKLAQVFTDKDGTAKVRIADFRGRVRRFDCQKLIKENDRVTRLASVRPDDIPNIVARRSAGETLASIASTFGVSRQRIHQLLKAQPC